MKPALTLKEMRRSWAEPLEYTQTELNRAIKQSMDDQLQCLRDLWVQIVDEQAPGVIVNGVPGVFLGEAALVKIGEALGL